MTKPLLLSSSLLFATLLSTACSTPGPRPDTDQMVLQVCLRKPLTKTRQLDFTIVRADKRDIESTMAIGKSLKHQPIFEAVAGNFTSIKATVLSIDNLNWYAFEPPKGASLDAWSDWQPADFISRSTDIAYKLQHDLPIDRDNGSSAATVQIRYRMMHYKDMLAARAVRRLELPHTDFAPC